MIKLLLITNRFPAHADDGASPFVADFVNSLKRHDIDTTVLTPHHHAEFYDFTYNTIRFKWGEEHRTIGALPKLSPISWMKMLTYFRQGNQEARWLHNAKDYDYCLALWAAPSGIFARSLKKQTGLPYAVWCLGSDIHTYPRIPIIKQQIVNVLEQADRIYCDGYELGEQAEKLAGKDCHFLPSMRKVSYKVSKTEKTEKLFVCPGRVERSKGVFDLLEAFRKIADEAPDWQLYFVGEGSARVTLEHRIEQYDLTRRVKSLGFVKRENMYRAIAKSTAVIIPTHADSLPLTFSEAMQLRRPVIASDIGDLKYFTEKYGVGQIVPAHSRDHLIRSMREFISGKVKLSNQFDECVNALSIDRAADTFANWLAARLKDPERNRESVVC